MLTRNQTHKRHFMFLGVGIVNTLLDFGFYTFLTAFVFEEPDNIAKAGLVSGTFALVCAFLTHSLITWRGSHITYKTIAKFIAFTGFGMWFIRPMLLSLFIKMSELFSWAYHISNSIGLPFSYDFVANTGAFGFMVVIVLAYNYFVYERFVFTSKRPPRHTDQESHSTS